MAEARSIGREVAGSLPTDTFILQTLFHIPVCILSSKTNHFGKDSPPNLSTDHYPSLAHDADRSDVLRVELNDLINVLCSTSHCRMLLLKHFIRGLMGSLPR